MAPERTPSADLLAANRRLLELREIHKVRPANRTPLPHQARPLTLAEVYQSLPPHLGWESAPVSVAIRRMRQAAAPEQEPPERDGSQVPRSAESGANQEENRTSITLFPTLALAMLRQEQVAAGRLRFLLRQLD